MIMCHRDPQQVIRLASRCRTENTDVVIHCDSAMPPADFDLVAEFVLGGGTGHLHLTARRIHGILDTRSLVDITMEMVSRAREVERSEGKHYQYYLLCSGQDYPIKPLPFIERELASAYPHAFIDCEAYANAPWMWRKFNANPAIIRYELWLRTHRRTLLRRGLFALELLWARSASALGLSARKRLEKQGVSLYGGSAWWILPDLLMQDIFEAYQQNTDTVRLLLEQTLTPEELFFQTMAMNSPHRELVELHPQGMAGQNCKTWAYFFDDDKPPQYHPYTFTAAEFPKLAASDAWFARKFDCNADSAVLDQIDEQILNN